MRSRCQNNSSTQNRDRQETVQYFGTPTGKGIPIAFRFEDEVGIRAITHTVRDRESRYCYSQAENCGHHSLHRLGLNDSIEHLSSFDVQSSTHSTTMADFMDELEDMFHFLNTKVARYTKNREIVDETRTITDFVRVQS